MTSPRPTVVLRLRWFLVLVMAGAAAACAAAPPDRPADPGTMVLRVDRGGGLVPMADRYRVPALVVYGDGTAVVAGPDQGALFTARRRTLTAGELSELFERAAGADLFENNTYDLDVQDGGSLDVRLRSTEGTFHTRVDLPSKRGSGDRRRTIEFAAAAEQAGTDAGEWVPERYAAVVVAASTGKGQVRPWPLPVPVEQMPGGPSRPCLEIDAAAAGDVLADARSAAHETRWQAGNEQVSIVVRPLLPDEPDCTALR